MKILLDTNIIIHRESHRMIKPEIGNLFNWIDNLNYSKYVHPLTIDELDKFKDKDANYTMSIKVENYNVLKYPAKLGELITQVSASNDKNANDKNDTQILNEVLEENVDILITEDKKIYRKAELLKINHKVFTIQKFLEKVTAENPELIDYKILAVKKVDFGQVILADSFFDSFREDYVEFDKWFRKKSEEPCYICNSNEILTAFLFLKVEDVNSEAYSDIIPTFVPRKRLKIGTLKVTSNGFKIGERFLKIVFDNAHQYNVEEIYVTVFGKNSEQLQLIEMLEEWGFIYYGIKSTVNGDEKVYVKPFSKKNEINLENPKSSFPFFSWDTNKYIIKIEHKYHTELFPDSINTKEDNSLYQDNEPHRNRIGKVYISHSPNRDLKKGDVFLIYRIGETSPKIHTSTITSICIVDSIKTQFENFEDFYNSCSRRTMINKKDLEKDWWNRFPELKPFVINFLYSFSLPTPKTTLKNLIELGIINDPLGLGRGFYKLDNHQFKKIVKFAFRNYNK